MCSRADRARKAAVRVWNKERWIGRATIAIRAGQTTNKKIRERAMMNLEKAQEDYRKRQMELLNIRRRHEQQAREYSEFMRVQRQRNGREAGQG